jgi:hypothetical protein
MIGGRHGDQPLGVGSVEHDEYVMNAELGRDAAQLSG